MIPKTITDKLNEGRTYRNVQTVEARAAGDSNEMIVEGYASTFNDPYTLWAEDGYTVLEQIDARAFDQCDMSDVIMQYNHEGRVFARISNGTLEVSPDDKGLAVRANLGGTDLGRGLYQEIAGGYTDKMSFGFRVAEDELTETDDHDTGETVILRTIKRISKLYDVSAVSIPANDATVISARSYGEGVIAELIEEHDKREALKKKIKILAEV